MSTGVELEQKTLLSHLTRVRMLIVHTEDKSRMLVRIIGFFCESGTEVSYVRLTMSVLDYLASRTDPTVGHDSLISSVPLTDTATV